MEGVHESVNDHTRRIHELEKAVAIQRTTIGEQIEIIRHVLERLHQLEEGERQRSRDEHARDVRG